MLADTKIIEDKGILEYPLAAVDKPGWHLPAEFLNLYVVTGADFFAGGSAELAIGNDNGRKVQETMRAITTFQAPDCLTYDANELNKDWDAGPGAFMDQWGSLAGTTAARDVTLDIAVGEFVVFLGPSGCGETTAMRMIAGLEKVSEGQVWIGDRADNALAPKDRDISMVFQSYGLYPNLTVYENIRFPLRVRGVHKAEHHERVMRASETVELGAFLDCRPAALSGGSGSGWRLPAPSGANRTPSFMDEPPSTPDAKPRVSTRAQIRNLHQTLKTTTI